MPQVIPFRNYGEYYPTPFYTLAAAGAPGDTLPRQVIKLSTDVAVRVLALSLTMISIDEADTAVLWKLVWPDNRSLFNTNEFVPLSILGLRGLPLIVPNKGWLVPKDDQLTLEFVNNWPEEVTFQIAFHNRRYTPEQLQAEGLL